MTVLRKKRGWGHITRKVAMEFSVHFGHEHINLEKIGHARLRGFVS